MALRQLRRLAQGLLFVCAWGISFIVVLDYHRRRAQVVSQERSQERTGRYVCFMLCKKRPLQRTDWDFHTVAS